MAKAASIAPPPRETKAAPANIEKPAGDIKYINFRVSRDQFIEVKKAALDAGMTLGDYLLHAHRAYQTRG